MKKNPEELYGWIGTGKEYLKLGIPEKSERYFHALIKRLRREKKWNLLARTSLKIGNAYFEVREYDLALKNYKYAIECNLKNGTPQSNATLKMRLA